MKTHHVAETEVSTTDPNSSQTYNLFHVSSGQSAPLLATVTVNGNPLSMEIDTGASVLIASLDTFESIREGEHSLKLEEPTADLYW